MKVTTLKVSSLAAIALVSILTACGSKEGKTEAAATNTPAATVAENEKIVFVNSDSLLTKYEYFKALRTKMEGKTKAAESDYTAKQQAFQREIDDYKVQESSLSASERADRQQKLQRKGQELQVYQQNAGAALQNESARENEALYNKVADYLKGYAKTKGYKMVLTYQKGNSAILFADESLDVTSDVIKGLNEAYAKDKK